MNVTTEINIKRNSMGGSGSSRQEYLSSNKSFNLAAGGNNINNAAPMLVTAIPVDVSMKDTVGLFGSENNFVKINVDIKSTTSLFTSPGIVENDFEPVALKQDQDVENDFFTAFFDFTKDPNPVDQFDPAFLSNTLSGYYRPVISVELFNLGTGNRFVVNWLDVQLYSRDRQPIDVDKIFTDLSSDIFVGIHARNTKRLPYNVKVVVGAEYLEYEDMTPAQRQAFY